MPALPEINGAISIECGTSCELAPPSVTCMSEMESGTRSTSDYGGVDELMPKPAPKPTALLADKGCDGDRFRENLLLSNILPIIPPRSNRKAPGHPDCRRYRDHDRNRIERMFGFLNLAAVRLWLKHFYQRDVTS